MTDKSHCVICDEEITSLGHKAYGCELCPRWLHSKYAFPNASNDDLVTLYKFYLGFEIKCPSCKQKSKVESDLLVKEITEIKIQLAKLTSKNIIKEVTNDVVHAVLDEKIKSDNRKAPLVNHALLIKPDKAGSLYNEDKWTDVVKKKLPKQLPNIPVSKAALTKNSQGYLSFTDQKSRDMQQIILNLHLLLRVRIILQNLLPKIKISGLETDSYANNSNGLLQLKQTILRKNEVIQNSIENQMKKFDILFISPDKQQNESFTVA